MKELNFNNAAKRSTYVGNLFEMGTSSSKKNVLNNIDSKFSRLHEEGYIHIHDLEAYGKTYNCLTPDILRNFPYDEFIGYSDIRKIIEIIDYYKYIISNLANEQTGGIAFANFDEEIEALFNNLNISPNESNLEILRGSLDSFINWVNVSRTRYGQECYYISLNLGLATGKVGRFVTENIIRSFMNFPSQFIKPNIIFKVKNGINQLKSDPNYDLFTLAAECTARRMIPTYLLCDSAPNRKFEPKEMAIMGCRTRVMQNLHGKETSIGRGNIDYITINLPRIALEVEEILRAEGVDKKIHEFKERWGKTAETVRDILLDRYYRLLKVDLENFPINLKHGLWIKDFNPEATIETVLRNGTLSIGFIGLSETVEILTGEKYFSSNENYQLALEIVGFMRQIVDSYRRELNLNFTLLATSGEYISGRFPEIDKNHFNSGLLQKGYYTNSFHVDVDSGMHPFEKLRYEGAFHPLCNGGCISYVEFSSAPLGNVEAIMEIIERGIEYGISYLGINYPLDICRGCGSTGTFDLCSECGSSDIKRIRRVSGYLEDLEFFTKGKKSEITYRKPNIMED